MSVSVFGGIPSFFRCCCRDAAEQRNRLDYSHPGYHLMLHLQGLVPYDADDEQWEAEVAELFGLLERQEFSAALQWFVARYPKCMALVPLRRRQKFLEGVYQNWLVETGQCNQSDADEQARIAFSDAVAV